MTNARRLALALGILASVNVGLALASTDANA
jgi:hypothetical protein